MGCYLGGLWRTPISTLEVYSNSADEFERLGGDRVMESFESFY